MSFGDECENVCLVKEVLRHNGEAVQWLIGPQYAVRAATGGEVPRGRCFCLGECG